MPSSTNKESEKNILKMPPTSSKQYVNGYMNILMHINKLIKKHHYEII